jgi:hypothetical protein
MAVLNVVRRKMGLKFSEWLIVFLLFFISSVDYCYYGKNTHHIDSLNERSDVQHSVNYKHNAVQQVTGTDSSYITEILYPLTPGNN